MHIREWKNAMRLGQGRKWLVERRKNCKRYMYQLCGTKRYVWIKLCAKVDGFSLIFSLMQKVNGGYWRLNCNEEVLLFYKEMWKCSIFYRKNDKTIEFKSLCPCQTLCRTRKLTCKGGFSCVIRRKCNIFLDKLMKILLAMLFPIFSVPSRCCRFHLRQPWPYPIHQWEREQGGTSLRILVSLHWW